VMLLMPLYLRAKMMMNVSKPNLVMILICLKALHCASVLEFIARVIPKKKLFRLAAQSNVLKNQVVPTLKTAITAWNGQ
jgi:hypothetical protein